MAERLTYVTNVFRSGLKVIHKESLQWFPMHMSNSLKVMQHKLRQMDLLIELHDARIPFSGRNSEFRQRLCGIKPHLFVLNKVDLIDPDLQEGILDRLRTEYEHVLFTNCKDINHSGLKQILPLAKKLIQHSDRYNRSLEEDFNIMVIGIPNVGKSTFINALRCGVMQKPSCAPVAPRPGVTLKVQTKIKVCDVPAIFLLDTPGILSPKIDHVEIGLKLALCNTILEHKVDDVVLCDYLLYWLNKHERYEYVNLLGLQEPTEDILSILLDIAVREKKFQKLKSVATSQYMYKPNIDYAANKMLVLYRSGKLGKYLLDIDFLKRSTEQKDTNNKVEVEKPTPNIIEQSA